MPLYFITGNAGKFREVSAIIPEIKQLRIDLDEIQSLDPQVVIEHKLYQAAAVHDGEFIVEDTSCILTCIKPLPGTMIKFFEESLGAKGISELVLRYPDHTATTRITIGYRALGGATYYFSAEYSGEIVKPKGNNGFGWDPIFIADGQTKTNAELTPEQKNAFSARGVAARLLAEHINRTKAA